MSVADQRKTMSGLKKHRMSINFNFRRPEKPDLVSPPGYSTSNQIANESVQQSDNTLLAKRSWEIALGPFKQLPMNLFITWMAGNSISIFPIMMVGMLLVRPIKALFSMGTTFKALEGNQRYLQKLTYILGNLVCLAFALYKCHSMGILPTHPSDWLDFLEPMERTEYSGGGLMF